MTVTVFLDMPMANITGVKGDVVEQRVEEIDSPGGRFTGLLTGLS